MVGVDVATRFEAQDFEVAKIAFKNGLAGIDEPEDLMAAIRAHMYKPVYPHYA